MVGAGIVGLATAWRLQRERPGLRVVVLDKEDEVAAHQTGHNSGVIHAGLYYEPGSLKARLCREGKAELEAFAAEHGIDFERCGKLVVATDHGELRRLQELFERARLNRVPQLRIVGPSEMRDIEPHVRGVRAIFSPTTGIIDFRQVTATLARLVEDGGGQVQLGREVLDLDETSQHVEVVTPAGPLRAQRVVTCAGLQSDRVAGMTGDAGDERIVPFRGNYYALTPDRRHLVKGLVYPVPDPELPFLGVHLTRKIDGRVWVGPNALLAFAREDYDRFAFDARDAAEALGFAGLWRLARRHWTFGAHEYWHDLVRPAMAREVRRFVPEVRARDLHFDGCGIRAQSLRADGTLLHDFSLETSERVLHVRNAPSPAATASLAIARVVAGRTLELAT